MKPLVIKAIYQYLMCLLIFILSSCKILPITYDKIDAEHKTYSMDPTHCESYKVLTEWAL